MAAGLPTPPSPHVGSPAAPTPRQLAVAESMLHYCAQTDPRAAVALRLQLDRYAGRISRTTLERLRTTDEYRRSYASVESFTQIVDPRNATRVCAEAVQTMQEAPSHAP
ncbi:MAG: hypothetical protein KGL92_12335 [Gammaproteobacteria bacterium]|nr:hypothetical protein [Gammaproteobacteria bacterium]